MFSPFSPEPLFRQSSAASKMPANEIIQGLWLGDASAAQDPDFIKRNNIGAIINCTKDVPISFPVEHMRLNVDDNLNPLEIQNMCLLIQHASSFLFKNHVLDRKNVLVHCAAGIQRSATVVAYYLAQHYKMSMADAIGLIVQKRPVAFFGGKTFNFGKCLGLA